MSYQRVVITRFGGPEVLETIQEPALPEPGAKEVRIRVLAAGAAFTDVMIRKGMYPEVKQKPPFSPGYDMVGIVDKTGPGTARLRPGQKVADLTVIGSYSEYLCLPEDRLTPVADHLDPAEAVGTILSYVTAYQLLHRVAEVQKGARILVHGAGGAVGTAMLQLGKLSELETYGTASAPKHELVSSLGATPIDYQRENWPAHLRGLAGGGFDAVFDPIGGQSLKRSFDLLDPGGMLVCYGFYNAVTAKGGSIPFDFMRLKLWNILPNGRRTAFYSIAAMREKHPKWFSADLTRLLDLLAQGEIKPQIAARMPLAEARQAHEHIEAARPKGKIVLIPGYKENTNG